MSENYEGWVLTTVAGNGEEGYSGDGGPANEATLNNPFDVVFDSKGRLIFTDTFGQEDIHTAAKADNAELLANRQVITNGRLQQDSTRDKPGNLDHADTLAILTSQYHILPLILFRRLV